MVATLKSQKKPVVLWIDDNSSLRKLAQRALTRTGFDCVTASSGADAISILDHIEPDLILMDIEMPGMNGFETCAAIKAIRKQIGRPHIPILMVSGHDDLEFLDQAYGLGILDIVLKPINWKMLVYRIRYILSNSDDSEANQT
ncbi:MAG TPA: response regulator [Crenotrichaceae bacterium]|nr:response regulator [Crenotrichaceae bacterium]